ncbi:MAG: GNAT family N-acetyltransferase [Anaerolineae bacterium]
MNIQIREAGIADFERLSALFVEENRFHAQLVPAYIQVTSPVLTREELQAFLDSRTHQLYVCEDGDTLLGAVIVSLKDTAQDRWNRPRLCGYIEDLIVTATARGHGVGRQLMQATRRWVASQGVQTIELHVWEANTGARRFYESLGLHSVQQRMIWELEEEV